MTAKTGSIVFDSEKKSGTIMPDSQDTMDSKFFIDLKSSPSAIEFKGINYVICRADPSIGGGPNMFIVWQVDTVGPEIHYWPLKIDGVDGDPNFGINGDNLYLFFRSGTLLTVLGITISKENGPNLQYPSSQPAGFCVGSNVATWYNSENSVTYLSYIRGNCSGVPHQGNLVFGNFPDWSSNHVAGQNNPVTTNPTVAFVSGDLVFFYQDGNTGNLMATSGTRAPTAGPTAAMSNSPSNTINQNGDLYAFYQGYGDNGKLNMVKFNPNALTFDKPVNDMGFNEMVNSPSAIYLESLGYMAIFYHEKKGHLGFTISMGNP